MNRKEASAQMRETWMVLREPQKAYPSRSERRAHLSRAKREARKPLPPAAEEAVQVPMQE